MAPNRKSPTCLVGSVLSCHDFHALHTTIDVKFLPLTNPLEQQHHEQQMQQQVQNQSVQESDSYWNWTSDDVEEEEQYDIFSLARIEANLLADAAKCNSSTSHRVTAHGDYWADQEQQTESSYCKPPQHESASYWDWSASPQTYEANLAARLTSTRNIEANLNAFVPSDPIQVHSQKEHHDTYWHWQSQEVPTHVSDPSHPHHDYWTWHAEDVPATKLENKQTVIQLILAYEAARQVLCTDRILKNLVEFNASSSCQKDPNSDSYWELRESYGEDYWLDGEAAPTLLSVGQGYWDW
jgi:hypothetical protein